MAAIRLTTARACGLVSFACLVALIERQQPEGVETAATTVFLLAVAIGALFLSRALTPKSGGGAQNEFDSSLATFASRNAVVPYVIGRRRVGATVVSVWDRSVVEEVVGSAGGKGLGGGGGDIKQQVYYEKAVHLVCLGPVTKLLAVYESGEALYDTATLPDVDGLATLDLGTNGSLSFRYGLDDDTHDFHRASISGDVLYSAKHKYQAFANWLTKRLGPSADWPQIEYLVECFCELSPLTGSAYKVTPSGGTVGVDDGVNAAHALYQVLTADWPFGAGYTTTEIDATSIQRLGVMCENEGIAVSLLIQGETVADVVDDLLSVMGAMMIEVDHKLAFVPVRPLGQTGVTDHISAPPDITVDDVLPPEAERTFATEVERPNRVQATFPDSRQNFRANGPQSMDADGLMELDNGVEPVEIQTGVVTSWYVMSIVADRKMFEAFGDSASISQKVGRAGLLIVPGEQVDVADVGLCRTQSRVISFETGVTTLNMTLDSYGSQNVLTGGDPPDSGGAFGPPACDLHVNIIEVTSSSMTNGIISLGLFRIRANPQISSANVFIRVGETSGTGTATLNSTTTRYASGGPIETAINAGAGVVGGGFTKIENGPIIRPLNADIEEVASNPLTTSEWEAGKRLMLVNDELFYGPREIDLVAETAVARSTAYSLGDTALPDAPIDTAGVILECVVAGTTAGTAPGHSGTTIGSQFTDGTVTWEIRPPRRQLKGLIREQAATTAATHAINSVVAIEMQATLRVIQDVEFEQGLFVGVKTQPRTPYDAVDPALCSWVEEEIDVVDIDA